MTAIQKPTLHQRLKAATRAAHTRLEARSPLLSPSLDIGQYRTILRTLYGLYLPLEAAMEATAEGTIRSEVIRRRKVSWLVEDLRTLGDTDFDIAVIPCCDDLPVVTTQPQLLGALYVVEGATLGGRFVVQLLRHSLGEDITRCARFFLSYGDQVDAMWATCLECVEASGRESPQHERAIIRSACDTFRSFDRWLAADPWSIRVENRMDQG